MERKGEKNFFTSQVCCQLVLCPSLFDKIHKSKPSAVCTFTCLFEGVAYICVVVNS